MGFFGGDHTDEMDLAAGLSAMVVGSHLPEDYEAGRFHLLSLVSMWTLARSMLHISADVYSTWALLLLHLQAQKKLQLGHITLFSSYIQHLGSYWILQKQFWQHRAQERNQTRNSLSLLNYSIQSESHLFI